MTKCPADKLTRAYLEERGYRVERGESYNAHTKRKKDLYGWIDYIGLHPNESGVLGIQTTSKSNLSARIRRPRRSPPIGSGWLVAMTLSSMGGTRTRRATGHPR